MSFRCVACNITFIDKGSLKVHYNYNHGKLPAEPDAADSSVADNNNSGSGSTQQFPYKFPNSPAAMTAISPGPAAAAAAADSCDFHLPPTIHQSQQHYDLAPVSVLAHPNHPYENYHLSHVEFHQNTVSAAVAAMPPASPSYAFGLERYHPYYKQQFRDGPRTLAEVPPPPPPSLHLPSAASYRCDKCNFVCATQDTLLHHMGLVHGIHLDMPPASNFTPPQLGLNGTVEQPKILDLDSQKVHVYKAAEGNRTVGMWRDDEKFLLQQQQQQQQQQLRLSQNGNATSAELANGGREGTPLHSVSTTTSDPVEMMQARSPYYDAATAAQISSTENGCGGRTSSSKSSSSSSSKNSNSGGGGNSWKSNEARRPKTYNCSACNKWFTSSGHLKRHYNTTLHKNAVKQSGAPDPSTLPVSAHHHPNRDPTYGGSPQPPSKGGKMSRDAAAVTVKSEPNANYNNCGELASRSPQPQSQPMQTPQPQSVVKVEPNSNYINFGQAPNVITGPSEISEGLLNHSSYNHQSPVDHHQQKQQQQQLLKSPCPVQPHSATPLLTMSAFPPDPTSYIPYGSHHHHHHHHLLHHQHQTVTGTAFFQPSMSTTAPPNFQSPHVSTTSQAITILNSSPIGESADDDENLKLPSFSCIQKNTAWQHSSADQSQMFLVLDDGGNVGGAADFISKDALRLLKNCDPRVEEEEEEEEDDWRERNELMNLEAMQKEAEQQQQQQQQLIEDTRVSSTTEKFPSTPPPPPLPSAAQMAVISCEKCHKFFNKTCYLTQHNKSFHAGEKPFKCMKCGKRYSSDALLKSHADKHAGNKPYKCDICPKAFNHKTDLRRHRCLHTDVRPYTCDICTKGFIRKDHMLKHRETHRERGNAARRTKTSSKMKGEMARMIEVDG